MRSLLETSDRVGATHTTRALVRVLALALCAVVAQWRTLEQTRALFVRRRTDGWLSVCALVAFFLPGCVCVCVRASPGFEKRGASRSRSNSMNAVIGQRPAGVSSRPL